MVNHILIDLDGVLADFFSLAMRVHGRDPSRMESCWPPGEWSIPKTLGISNDEFWAEVDIAQLKNGFWESLDPYPWKDDLLGLTDLPFTIATSPSLDHRCASAKVSWMRKHIGDRFKDYMIGSQKYLMARDSIVLIDDSDRNVELFREHGGKAILFPQPWNQNYAICGARVRFVVDELESLGVSLREAS